jgi:hypothetical protein
MNNTMIDLVRNKTVAVVGNSSSLFEKDYGEFIDSHDIVIRFNKPAIFYKDLECEKSHGKKIDAWAFVSYKSFEEGVLLKEDSIEEVKKNFYENDKIKKLYVKKTEKNEEDSITYPGNYSMLLRIDIANNIAKYKISNLNKIKKRFPYRIYEYNCTTGLIILHWLFMSAPKKVSIFGFDFKMTPTFSEKERFEEEIQNRLDTRCKHNFEVEEIYVKNVLLPRRKNFRLYE